MELSTDTLGISLAGLVTLAVLGLWIPGHWIPGPKRHWTPGTLDFQVNFTIPETGSMIYDFAFWSATHLNLCNSFYNPKSWNPMS